MGYRILNTWLTNLVQSAGRLLLRHWGRPLRVRRKQSHCSVVTDADVAAEQHLIRLIRARYPSHNILGEESGWQSRGSEFTWVLDPLDGTSNFVAGLPWWGVMVALLHHGRPVQAAVYLPVPGTLYLATERQGVRRDGRRVRVSQETDLRNVLCAFGTDATGDPRAARRTGRLLERLIESTRNLRMTNSLVDFCGTVDGRFGVCLNQFMRIWDVAPFVLMMKEARGALTNLRGEPIRLSLGSDAGTINYPVVAGNPHLHKQILAILP